MIQNAAPLVAGIADAAVPSEIHGRGVVAKRIDESTYVVRMPSGEITIELKSGTLPLNSTVLVGRSGGEITVRLLPDALPPGDNISISPEVFNLDTKRAVRDFAALARDTAEHLLQDPETSVQDVRKEIETLSRALARNMHRFEGDVRDLARRTQELLGAVKTPPSADTAGRVSQALPDLLRVLSETLLHAVESARGTVKLTAPSPNQFLYFANAQSAREWLATELGVRTEISLAEEGALLDEEPVVVRILPGPDGTAGASVMSQEKAAAELAHLVRAELKSPVWQLVSPETLLSVLAERGTIDTDRLRAIDGLLLSSEGVALQGPTRPPAELQPLLAQWLASVFDAPRPSQGVADVVPLYSAADVPGQYEQIAAETPSDTAPGQPQQLSLTSELLDSPEHRAVVITELFQRLGLDLEHRLSEENAARDAARIRQSLKAVLYSVLESLEGAGNTDMPGAETQPRTNEYLQVRPAVVHMLHAVLEKGNGEIERLVSLLARATGESAELSARDTESLRAEFDTASRALARTSAALGEIVRSLAAANGIHLPQPDSSEAGNTQPTRAGTPVSRTGIDIAPRVAQMGATVRGPDTSILLGLDVLRVCSTLQGTLRELLSQVAIPAAGEEPIAAQQQDQVSSLSHVGATIQKLLALIGPHVEEGDSAAVEVQQTFAAAETGLERLSRTFSPLVQDLARISQETSTALSQLRTAQATTMTSLINKLTASLGSVADTVMRTLGPGIPTQEIPTSGAASPGSGNQWSALPQQLTQLVDTLGGFGDDQVTQARDLPDTATAQPGELTRELTSSIARWADSIRSLSVPAAHAFSATAEEIAPALRRDSMAGEPHVIDSARQVAANVEHIVEQSINEVLARLEQSGTRTPRTFQETMQALSETLDRHWRATAETVRNMVRVAVDDVRAMVRQVAEELGRIMPPGTPAGELHRNTEELVEQLLARLASGSRERIEQATQEIQRVLSESARELDTRIQQHMRSADSILPGARRELDSLIQDAARDLEEISSRSIRTAAATSTEDLARQVQNALHRLESLQILARPTQVSEGQQQIVAFPMRVADEWTEVTIRLIRRRARQKSDSKGKYSVVVSVSPRTTGNISAHMMYTPNRDLGVSVDFERESSRLWFERNRAPFTHALREIGFRSVQVRLHETSLAPAAPSPVTVRGNTVEGTNIDIKI